MCSACAVLSVATETYQFPLGPDQCYTAFCLFTVTLNSYFQRGIRSQKWQRDDTGRVENLCIWTQLKSAQGWRLYCVYKARLLWKQAYGPTEHYMNSGEEKSSCLFFGTSRNDFRHRLCVHLCENVQSPSSIFLCNYLPLILALVLWSRIITPMLSNQILKMIFAIFSPAFRRRIQFDAVCGPLLHKYHPN